MIAFGLASLAAVALIAELSLLGLLRRLPEEQIGLMVVPNTATTIRISSRPSANEGKRVETSTSTAKATAT